MAGDVKAKYNFFNPPGLATLVPACKIEGCSCSRAEERNIGRYVSDGGDATDPGDDEFGR